ncbi:MAG: MotA/TolQ/ExbB proton channel family protein [Parachlamydiales bacterium]|nr:MotA/TolQ/ExbB proton channel family protein [Parachlamydiales bacterium]
MLLLLSSPIISAYFQSDFFGKLIFVSLFALSILSWVILLHKLYLAKRLKKLNYNFEQIVNSKKDNLLSISINTNFSYPYYNIYKNLKEKTLEILNKNRFFINKEGEQIFMCQADMDLLDNYLESEISNQTKYLERNMFILPTVVTLGPFLGLLGTVWGILITFNGLQANSMINTNSTVLSGLSMALATTVLGLVVAIPALIAYNYLRHWIKNYQLDMENFSQKLLTTLEIQYRKVDFK